VTTQQLQRSAYAILGLHKGAGEDEVKQAYVTLVKKYDPERHTDRFMVIQGAFERLKDPDRRAREDVLTYNFIRGQYGFSNEEQVEVPEPKLQQAIETVEQKLQADPQNAAQYRQKLMQGYMIRSCKNVRKKLLKEAIEDWLRVLAIDPTHRRAKSNLLYAYISLGYAFANHTLYDEAISLWEKAVEMDPDNDQVIHNLALACEMAGRPADARRYWEATVGRWRARLDAAPQDLYLKSIVVEGLRHQAELGSLGEGAPSPARASAPAGAATASPGPTAAAAGKASGDEGGQIREILKLRPDDFDANFRLANILMDQKKWAEAAEHLAELTKKFPRNIEVINALGWALLNNQQVDDAFRAWRRGLKLDPKNFTLREALIKGHMLMGRALRDKNLFINALVHFKELAKYAPDSDEVHYELGRTYQLKGDPQSAFQEFQTVVKLNPKHKPARVALSELKMRRA